MAAVAIMIAVIDSFALIGEVPTQSASFRLIGDSPMARSVIVRKEPRMIVEPVIEYVPTTISPCARGRCLRQLMVGRSSIVLLNTEN